MDFPLSCTGGLLKADLWVHSLIPYLSHQQGHRVRHRPVLLHVVGDVFIPYPNPGPLCATPRSGMLSPCQVGDIHGETGGLAPGVAVISLVITWACSFLRVPGLDWLSLFY